MDETTFESSEWVSFKAVLPNGKTYGNVDWSSYNGSSTLDTFGGKTRYPRGNHTVTATICKSGDPSDCLQATYTFTTTNSKPDTPIIYMTPSERIGRYTKVYFAHDVTKDIDGDELTFEWKLDNNPWSNYPPNGIFSSGEHKVSLRARDTSHVYSDVATKTFSILNAPPTKPVVVTLPKTDIRTIDEVTFNAFSTDFDRDPFTFEWKLDDGEWSKTKPKTTLPRGQHIIFVKATDSKGNYSQIGYTIFDVINTPPSAPKITIEPNSGSTAITEITLKASGSVDVDGDKISYEIKVGDGEWGASPTIGKYPRGEHTVYARAKDSLGEYSAISTKKLIIENTKPTKPNLEVILGPLGISSEDVSFIASGSTDLDADPLSYFWKVDDGEWSSVSPNGKFKKGEHTVYVRAADNYNGVSEEASYTFTIQNSAPTAPTIKVNPENLTTASIAEFTAEGSIDYDGDPLSFEWSIDNGSWLSAPPNGSLSLGNHIIAVRAKDTEGLYSPVTTTTIVVSKPAPTLPTLTMSPSDSLTTDSQITFSATATSSPNSFLTYYWSVDGGPWSITAPNGKFSEGTHTVSVQTKDTDGTSSAIASKTFVVTKAYDKIEWKESFEGVSSAQLSVGGSWTISSLTSNTGSRSLTSGTTANGSSNTATLQFTIPNNAKNAYLSFDYLVRSEKDKDIFTYTINGTVSKPFSGFGSWSNVNTPLESGNHTITFTYKKDATGSTFDDAAFIDSIKVTFQQEKN